MTAGGREDAPLDVAALVAAAEALGAGEFMCNCIDCDGKGGGFDLPLLRLVKARATAPVIASSGAGAPAHFAAAFAAGVDAALAAGIFHRREVAIADVKAHVRAAGIVVRD